MMTTRFKVLAGMVLTAAMSRLIPHPPNFAPIAAMALFGGAHFKDKRAAVLVPLAAMFLSDLIIGLHGLIPVVYGSFAAIACLGMLLRDRIKPGTVAAAALGGSALFFITTNFGVWALGSTYPKTPSGLMACYTAAIPFFGNTLCGDMFYAGALFGAMALAETEFPAVRENHSLAQARA
jgi:hypothetical protein